MRRTRTVIRTSKNILPEFYGVKCLHEFLLKNTNKSFYLIAIYEDDKVHYENFNRSDQLTIRVNKHSSFFNIEANNGIINIQNLNKWKGATITDLIGFI